MAPARRLGMFPLSTVLFPHAELPLHVFEPRYRSLTEDCLAGDRRFGVVLISRGSEVGGGDERYRIGTVARIEAVSRLDDGRLAVLARGTRRIAVARWLADAPYPVAEVEEFPASPDTGVEAYPGAGPDGTVFATAAAAVRRVRALLSELGSPAPVVGDLDDGPGDTGLWRLCALAPLATLDRQRLLETDGPDAVLALLTELCVGLADDLVRLLGRAPTDDGV